MVVIKKDGDGVKRLCAVLVACVVMWYSVITAPVIRVSASDSALGDWANSFVIGQIKSQIKNAIISNFSSADQTTLNILDAELGFCMALGQDVWAMENEIDDFSINGQTFQVLSGVCYIPVDGTNELCTCTMTFSPSGLVCRSDYGVYAVVRGVTGTSPWLSWTSNSCIYHLTGSSSNRFLLYSGSYFDNPTPCETQYFTNSSFTFSWFSSGNPPVVSQNSWNYESSSISGYCQSILRTNLQPISVDTSSDDITTVMSAYKSSLGSQLGITVDDIDDIWTLPDEIPEDPTDSSSPCGCQRFTLPPEWVESDVVELETDHYEVPFESMVADPFDYLVSPYTQTSTETVRGATKSVPISPPTPQYQVFPSSGNVQETAVGFVNLAYTLLNRSGLDYVIGIAVFGLCVSLLVL